MKITEKLIENSILDYLNRLPNCIAIKYNYQARILPNGKYFKTRNKNHINGVSDILCLYDGKFIAFEVKRDAKAARSIDQINFITKIRNIGGYGFFVWNVEQVISILEDINKIKNKE